MSLHNNITVFILAGGKSSRMGSDKGLVPFKGKKMIEHIIATCKSLTNNIGIVTNNPDYNFTGLTLVADVIKDNGPLAGIYSALLNSKTNYNLVISCDMPLLNVEILDFLLQQCDNNHQAFVIKHNGQTEPLCAVYTSDCRDVFKKRIEAEQLGVYHALKDVKCKYVDVSNEPFYSEQAFINVNSPDELQQLEEVRHD